MEWYLIIILALCALLAALIGVILVRTLMFKPKKQPRLDFESIPVDKEGAVQALAALVRCATVSSEDPAKEDEAEFQKLIDLLPVLYPHVCETCPVITFPGRARLYHWKGKTPGKVAVLMAHYDVVSVVEENWEKPPFAGIIEDGVLWGRGTLDTKVTFNGVMYGAETLISQGFVPEHDIYFAFSGGEEVNGPGAKNIVNWFRENNVEIELVVDEGGAVVDNVFPGVHKPAALVGIAEKGMINMQYKVKSPGGHASAPKPHSPLVTLSETCLSIERHPFPAHFTAPILGMFDTLGRESTFVYRMIFANMWLFRGLLGKISAKSGGEMNAMLRTTVAFTQSEGSIGANVIPPVATMVSNMRLNPEDTVESAKAYLEKVVNNKNVELNILCSEEPSPVSRTDVPGYDRVCRAIKYAWDNVLVSPYLMIQCSDCRHYGEISDRVYRFSACDMTAEERSTIHGNNERIRTETVGRSIDFYVQLMKQC